MKLFKLIFGVMVLCLSLTAYANTPAQKNQTDGEIISYLIVINKNEIAVANLALHKTTNPNIKQFAKSMVSAHGDNLNATLKVSKQERIAPVDTKDVDALKETGQKELKKLSVLQNKDFDDAYAQAMVKDHTDALSLLEGLLVNVTNKPLKEHLENTHNAVGKHLQMAKSLEAKV